MNAQTSSVIFTRRACIFWTVTWKEIYHAISDSKVALAILKPRRGNRERSQDGGVTYHYVWLAWSGAFLVLWVVLYVAYPLLRTAMRQTSAITALFGLTEPIFIPNYWNPPSLFDLAQRTGFDLESIVFSFAIGGIGIVLYHAVSATHIERVPANRRVGALHRFHTIGLLGAPIAFVPLALLPWNVIYAVITSLLLGSMLSVICRPVLARATIIGGGLFFVLYAAFMLGLTWFTPSFIPQVWNLRALSGVLVVGIPLEELLFGAVFGMYWSSVYEHFTWSESVSHAHRHARGSRRDHDSAGADK